MGLPIGLQPHTVRDHLAEDYEGTLRAVAEMGYDAVQTGSTGPLTPEQFVELTESLGLRVKSAHIGALTAIDAALDEKLATLKAVGVEDLVVSWAGPERFESLEAVRALAAELEAVAKHCKGQGFTLAYHNHAHEFMIKVEDGRDGFFALMDEADPDLVKAEVDLGWAKAGGADPATVVRSLGARCISCHIKDINGEKDDQDRWVMTEIGDGMLDWSALIALGKRVGVKHWFYENDYPQIDSLESARESVKYLKSLEIVKKS